MEVHHDGLGAVDHPLLEVAAVLHVEGAGATRGGAQGPGGHSQQPAERQPLRHLRGGEEEEERGVRVEGAVCDPRPNRDPAAYRDRSPAPRPARRCPERLPAASADGAAPAPLAGSQWLLLLSVVPSRRFGAERGAAPPRNPEIYWDLGDRPRLEHKNAAHRPASPWERGFGVSGGERKKEAERFVTKVHLEVSCQDAVQRGGVLDMLYKTRGGLLGRLVPEKKKVRAAGPRSVRVSLP